ncbi:MOSC domain-containing protein [Roseibium sp.]|uniref:MOSC domain-containing protein n=1 Tax=Roseibium sp. TaxID=1936156 RepID=UPI003A96DB24
MSSPDTLSQTLDALKIVPARKISATVTGLFQTANPEQFQTVGTETLLLKLEGIPGDRHGGYTRRSGGREPWYPRGTEMCNERQVSLLAPDELALVARRMELDRLEPEWIGGNIVLDGLPNLSLVPPRTRLVFEGGAVIRVDGDNAPCRAAGRSIADQFPDREGLDLLFPKVARRLRGLVGYVEKPGSIEVGEAVTAMIGEQWIYAPS